MTPNHLPPTHLPREAVILERIQESPTIFTLRMELADDEGPFRFEPGQFNMVYPFGVGEVPLSIVSDPEDARRFDHTVRVVGRVTEALDRLRPGDRVGIRGPFGRGWPMEALRGRDILLVTGGLGCAPVVSVIRYMMRRRADYGRIVIMQGVRHADDLIWSRQYAEWSRTPGTQVLLAADVTNPSWPGHKGTVVELFQRLDLNPANTITLLCGPEVMILASIGQLRARGFEDGAIWVSLERNMQCGDGRCGSCQIGPKFVCKDGPVFAYAEIADFFGTAGV